MTNRDDERREITDIAADYTQPPPSTPGIVHRHDPVLPIPSVIGGVTVALGLNALIPGGGMSHNLTVLLGGASAFALSLFVNKSLFHVGSKLAATGDKVVIGLATGWFFGVAGIFGTISFTGMTNEMNQEAILREPIAHIASAGRGANEGALGAHRLAPVISAVAGDLRAIASCEVNAGCVSGRRGRGAQVAGLETLESKLVAVEQLYTNGERKRKLLASELEGLASRYEEQLTQHGVAHTNRAKLVAIYTRAQAVATELGSVVPTAAARGLAGELRNLQVAPGQPGRIDVAARLRGHASQIEDALADVTSEAVVLPPFPRPAGIASGWSRISETWPIAVFLFGVEGLVIVLWILLVRDLRARLNAGRALDRTDPTDAPTAGAVAVPTHQPAYSNGDARQAGGSHDPRPARQRHT